MFLSLFTNAICIGLVQICLLLSAFWHFNMISWGYFLFFMIQRIWPAHNLRISKGRASPTGTLYWVLLMLYSIGALVLHIIFTVGAPLYPHDLHLGCSRITQVLSSLHSQWPDEQHRIFYTTIGLFERGDYGCFVVMAFDGTLALCAIAAMVLTHYKARKVNRTLHTPQDVQKWLQGAEGPATHNPWATSATPPPHKTWNPTTPQSQYTDSHPPLNLVLPTSANTHRHHAPSYPLAPWGGTLRYGLPFLTLRRIANWLLPYLVWAALAVASCASPSLVSSFYFASVFLAAFFYRCVHLPLRAGHACSWANLSARRYPVDAAAPAAPGAPTMPRPGTPGGGGVTVRA
ncbi:hypothetical protein PAPYR_8772 [Paratrimastix pyriformis]|uniref:Uncharacterized protein n=1 Tax=Paratrimastix pyriformis TaxID=342808 RepID=A0ABQ8U9Y8_9EUKA|nr:hypothetical protein PAPYR_8772 [Paratrimastix pyriformis]